MRTKPFAGMYFNRRDRYQLFLFATKKLKFMINTEKMEAYSA